MELDPILTKRLYADFPHLYRGRHKPAQESSMCWGFECGDGWYLLLHDLSSQLSSYLAEHPDSDFEAIQVKSKFGRLCFHLSDHDAVVEEMIDTARERAAATCEITGRPGQLCSGKSRRDPLMVLCPEKAEEFGYSVVIR